MVELRRTAALIIAATLVGAACVAEGYYLYLRKALLAPPAAESAGPARLPAREEAALHPSTDSLEQRLRARTDAAGVRSTLTSTDTELILTVLVPGLRSESLRIEIAGAGLLIDCSAALVEETGGRGGGYRRETTRRYEMVIPIPPNADTSRPRLIRGRDAFSVIFTRLADSSLKF